MRPVRTTVALTALTALITSAALLSGTATAAPPVAPTQELLATVHTAGRVTVDDGALEYSWPGVYFEGSFRGTGVGIVLNDSASDYDIAIDGTTTETLVTPGQTTHWIEGLTDGVHSVRVVKRGESPWSTSTFGGFVAAPGGVILDAPPARDRQIEFIGDSYTAGYGNMSTTRECTGDQVNRMTNADLSFGALTARSLDADYQINAFSGRGMVRNYSGGEPGTSYRTYYDRALLNVNGDVWKKPSDWQPQLVVVGLGINDFSTDINAGEAWTSETLRAGFRAAYNEFLDTLRAKYGPDTVIVVSGTYMSNTTALADMAQQVVQDRHDSGDALVHYWYYGNEGLDYTGCHWHPSLHDDQVISQQLNDFIATLPLNW